MPFPLEVPVAGDALDETLYRGVVHRVAHDHSGSRFVLGENARLAQQGLSVTGSEDGLAMEKLILQELARLGVGCQGLHGLHALGKGHRIE